MCDNDDHIYEVDFMMIITYPYLSFMMLENFFMPIFVCCNFKLSQSDLTQLLQ